MNTTIITSGGFGALACRFVLSVAVICLPTAPVFAQGEPVANAAVAGVSPAARETAVDQNSAANKPGNVAPVADMPSGVLQLDETVISGNQELPKVLYILPWREPQGLPDIEIQAEFTEAEVFRRLYPPAYRRELSYFDTLRGLEENISPDQEE